MISTDSLLYVAQRHRRVCRKTLAHISHCYSFGQISTMSHIGGVNPSFFFGGGANDGGAKCPEQGFERGAEVGLGSAGAPRRNGKMLVN